MASSDTTHWSLIQRAADGETSARDAFAQRYESVIRAYLGARWRGTPLVHEIDDAAQETFLACLKEGGALGRVDPSRGSGFRAYLYGVVRNVARRLEERREKRERQPGSRLDLNQVESREEPLSNAFDRAWARAILREATRLQTVRARADGDGAVRRLDLLRLRFRDNLPIREIARRWDEEPARLHKQYAKARQEFATALRDVVREHHEGTPAEVERECARLASFFR